MKYTRILTGAATGAALLSVAVAAPVSAKVEGDTIVLGSAISFTGKYSTNGVHAKNGYDLAWTPLVETCASGRSRYDLALEQAAVSQKAANQETRWTGGTSSMKYTRILTGAATGAALLSVAVAAPVSAKVEGDTIVLGSAISFTGKYSTNGVHAVGRDLRQRPISI